MADWVDRYVVEWHHMGPTFANQKAAIISPIIDFSLSVDIKTPNIC